MYRLFLLGKIDFRDDFGSELRAILAQPRRLAVVAYLAVRADARRRDELIGLFWPEQPQERGRQALNKAIHFARHALGDGAIVSRSAEDVALDRSYVWCDVVAFEEAVASGMFAEALALYRGELLPGFYVKDAPAFDEWLEAERARLRRLAADAAHADAVLLEQDGQVAAAAHRARQAVELSDTNERFMRDLLAMLDRLGDRAGALHAYDAFARRLAMEFGAEPAAETQALMTRIRSRAEVRERAHPGPTIANASVSVVDTMGQLRPSRGKRFAALRWGVAITLASFAAWGWLRPARSAAVPRARLEMIVPDSVRIRADLAGQVLALAHDGSRVVWLGGSGTPRLYLHVLNEENVTPIRGTENAMRPEFSPDDRWIAFVQGTVLKKVPVAGGPALTIANDVSGFDWGDRDVVVFTRLSSGKLFRVNGNGGAPQLVVAVDSAHGEEIVLPRVLPGAKAVVFAISTHGDRAHATLAAARIGDGEIVRLGITGVNARYLTSGHLVVGRMDGTVVAASFDARRLRVAGPPLTVLERALTKGGGAMEFAVSDDGTLAYIQGRGVQQLTIVDRRGRDRLALLAVPDYAYPRFSPDGRRIALRLSDSLGYQHNDVWVYTIATRTLTRLTHDGMSDRPEWSADGTRIMWLYRHDGGIALRRQAWNGSGNSETLLESAKFTGGAIVESRRGHVFAGVWRGESTLSDIFVATGDPPGAPRTLVGTPAQEGGPKVSPDGRWLAYYGEESGSREVYVTGVSGGARFQVSSMGGVEPVWAPDGTALYYRSAGKLMRATIATTPEFRVVRRDTMFAHDYAMSGGAAGFDVSPDGSSFVMLRPVDRAQRVVVVTGWMDDVRERMSHAVASRERD